MMKKRVLVLCIGCHHATAEIGTSHCRYCARHAIAGTTAERRECQLSFNFERLAPRLTPSRYDNLVNRSGIFVLDKPKKLCWWQKENA